MIKYDRMKTMDKNTVTASELKETLKIKEDRTIELYIKEGVLPQPVKEEDEELLFDKEEILNILGAKTLEEEFINAAGVAEILNITKTHVQALAKKGYIPSYRLKSVKGSKTLYLRSEIEAANTYRISWSNSFPNRLIKDNIASEVISKVLNWKLPLLTERACDIYKQLMVENEGLKKTADKFGLTEARVRNIFERSINQVLFSLEEIYKQAMLAEVKEAECIAMKQKLEQYEEKERAICALPENVQHILFKKLDDFYLSTRLLNCLRAADILTVGELVVHSKRQLSLFRNMGRKSVDEVEELVKTLGLRLEMKLNISKAA